MENDTQPTLPKPVCGEWHAVNPQPHVEPEPDVWREAFRRRDEWYEAGARYAQTGDPEPLVEAGNRLAEAAEKIVLLARR